MTTTRPILPPDSPRLDRQRRVGRLVLAALMLTRALPANALDAPAPLVWTRVEAVQAEGDLAQAQAAPAPPVTALVPAGPQSVARGTRYDALIDAVARQFDLDARLLHAMIETESRYNADARSPKGAVGLMQVMPATGRRFGFTNLADPDTNVRAGATYLKWLLKTFDDDLELAVAGYNAGEGAVMKAGRKIPPYQETQHYVRTVLTRYRSNNEVATPLAATTTRAAISRTERHRSTPATMLGKLASLLLSSPRASASASP
ncbi:peptidoglycan N-acetylmuramoylhydrolase [Burkholderia ubonensis]|uniref:lytic transglycosylase domain-containing protein n=1 Tax=Burkholderia ubonensis TaxID=101571 RepID=UPI0007551F0C|nr:lytic transglycosylase domain-containing protein [Burkholderia ubonensis]KVV41077.1 peptidoglycan N-acetylmuramoylhydrolase [Burkholderia ubonensis]KVW14062.1 peptidoglycan N-acetylmuramoylhydrolase [Burkholderia ubonensis]